MISLTKPCGDCPFRKKSLPGWLGTFALDGGPDYLQRVALSELPFSCHTASNDETNMYDASQPQCVGRLIFATHNCKSFRNEELEEQRLRIKEVVPQAIKDSVLGMLDFVAHHKKKLPQK